MKLSDDTLRTLLLGLCVAFGVAACADDEVTPPATDTTGTTTATTTGTTTTTTSGSTTSTTSGTTTTTDNTDDSSTDGTTTETTNTDPACEGANGCFSCVPTTSKQLINACTDAQCQPFPITKERLPLLNADGSLPPLP